MNQESNRKTGKKTASSRREFLKHTGTAAAGAALTSAISSRSYAAENNTINLDDMTLSALRILAAS